MAREMKTTSGKDRRIDRFPLENILGGDELPLKPRRSPMTSTISAIGGVRLVHRATHTCIRTVHVQYTSVDEVNELLFRARHVEHCAFQDVVFYRVAFYRVVRFHWTNRLG